MNSSLSVFDRSLNRSPLRDFRNMQRQMDRLFDQAWNRGGLDLDADIIAGPVSSALSTPAFSPSCDISESDTHYLMSFDLPGIKTEDVKIDLRDNTLIVSGERKEEREENQSGLYRSERFYGNFERSFALPANAKGDQIEANYADGVLRVAIPKAEVTQAKQIPIGEKKAGFMDRFLSHKKEEAKKSASH